MLSKEKIASLANLLYLLVEEYTIGFENTDKRMLKPYMTRIKAYHHINGSAKHFQEKLIPKSDLIAQYTMNSTNHTKVFDSFGECNDTTTFHISIIEDAPYTTNKYYRSYKDNYYIMSKDYKNLYIAIPKRMVEIGVNNREAINFYIRLLYQICEGYWSRTLVPYMFCKYVFKLNGSLASELYVSGEFVDTDIESYIDNVIFDRLYKEPLNNTIIEQLKLLQEGDETIWKFIQDTPDESSEYLGVIPYFYWDDKNEYWVKY